VPIFARCARLTEIVINDTNPLAWPAERDRPFNQAILQLRTFLMVADLPWRGLPHIDEAKLRAVRRRDPFVSHWRRGQHNVFPPADAAGIVGVAADEPVAALAGVASRAQLCPQAGQSRRRFVRFCRASVSPTLGRAVVLPRGPHSATPARRAHDSPTAKGYAPKCARHDSVPAVDRRVWVPSPSPRA
jgi:hypothetical protein